MPVELRKRKAPAPPPEPAPAPKKRTPKPKVAASKAKAAASKAKGAAAPKPRGRPAKAKAAADAEKPTAEPAAAPAEEAVPNGPVKPAVGSILSLDDFGGEVEFNEGGKTTLKQLVEESNTGVVLFTYPKASTPGCTRQVCLFRDAYEPLTTAGLSIFGLSTDSPKANTTFKEKQKLQYPLLCDPEGTLIAAIGFRKAPKGTARGVFVIEKSGKVLAAEPGGPEATVNIVKKLVEGFAGPKEAEKVPEPAKVEEAAAKEEDKTNGVVDKAEGEKKDA
ncbi:hypothetical protein OQA88_13567 [Cercophora sp. LCS_1]